MAAVGIAVSAVGSVDLDSRADAHQSADLRDRGAAHAAVSRSGSPATCRLSTNLAVLAWIHAGDVRLSFLVANRRSTKPGVLKIAMAIGPRTFLPCPECLPQRLQRRADRHRLLLHQERPPRGAQAHDDRGLRHLDAVPDFLPVLPPGAARRSHPLSGRGRVAAGVLLHPDLAHDSWRSWWCRSSWSRCSAR